MSRHKQAKGRIGAPFVAVLTEHESAWCSAAWKAMSAGARVLYIAIKRHYRLPAGGNPGNNGKLYLAARKAGEELGFGKSQVAEYFRELQHYGFIVATTGAWLGVDGHAKSPHWRLTELGYMHDPPTRDYLKWDGVLFERRKRPSRLHMLHGKKTESRPERADMMSGAPDNDVRGSGQQNGGLSARSGHIASADCPHAPDISTSPSGVGGSGLNEGKASAAAPSIGHSPGPPLKPEAPPAPSNGNGRAELKQPGSYFATRMRAADEMMAEARRATEARRKAERS